MPVAHSCLKLMASRLFRANCLQSQLIIKTSKQSRGLFNRNDIEKKTLKRFVAFKIAYIRVILTMPIPQYILVRYKAG